jgi:hypothetical protein
VRPLCMMAADIFVSDVRTTLAKLTAALGLPEDQFVRQGPNLEFQAAHARVHPDPALGTTVLELIGRVPLSEQQRRDSPQIGDFITALMRWQSELRPMHSHCTPLVTEDLPALQHHLRTRNVPFLESRWPGDFAPGHGYPWIGLSGDPATYDPSYDGGLMLEFVSPQHGSYPEEVVSPEVPKGTLVRVTARSHLVESIDDVLAALRSTLEWPDADDVYVDERDGYRCASIGFTMATSARLELLEPLGSTGSIAEAFSIYGPGPWVIRLGVRGLDRKLDDLDARGTRWQRLPPIGGQARVSLDRRDVLGALLELEELDQA